MEDKNYFRIVNYRKEFAPYFYDLNIAWLKKHFYVEEYDKEVLSHPEKYILDKGGSILFAMLGEKVVGVSALINRGKDGLELSKMAVSEDYQGQHIGKKLMYASITKAIEQGTHRLFLDSNTLLKPAIQLYKQVGFKEIPVPEDTPYERCNIRMEILF
jgi:N-acetylglutamate synthase-like GNAT family acetyltransferase